MPKNELNIYAKARKAAGFTRERAAEILGVTPRRLFDMEIGAQLVSNDLAQQMIGVYGAPWLAIQHLNYSCAVFRDILPPVEPAPLSQATCHLLDALRRFAAEDKDRDLLAISADGHVSPEETEAYLACSQGLRDIVQAALEVQFHRDFGA